MMRKTFLRASVLSVAGLFCTSSPTFRQTLAQQVQGHAGAHLESVVFDGSTRAGWYSFPGQRPKLKFTGNDVRITSRQHSTVMLRREASASGGSAEVSLIHPPMSTSSISGLAVMSDADHAMVIGLEGGNVVLWQLDPGTTRVVARHPVNATAPLEFRVTGEEASQARFYWRHPGDAAWHGLGGESTADSTLASWHGPLHFGLLLDGPQGSQVTFSNYRTGSFGEGGTMTAMLTGME